MSSTSIVVKCLTDAKATNSMHGQITIGTLILQVCLPPPPRKGPFPAVPKNCSYVRLPVTPAKMCHCSMGSRKRSDLCMFTTLPHTSADLLDADTQVFAMGQI